MNFCFIIEEQYRKDSMPMAALEQLVQWGHTVDILEPQATITCLSDLIHQNYDAYVLKTVSDGPGLSILEAAEAIGIPTINHSQAIRRVRDKAVAMAMAAAQGIPAPITYFVAQRNLLHQVPVRHFPLVVKPTNGSSCRDIHYFHNPAELMDIDTSILDNNFWLAQHYEENTGFDIKIYVAGTEVFAAAKPSPLHPEITIEKRPIALSPALHALALDVGTIFGLDIFGLDVVETAHGPRVVDINDFPSFGSIPDAEKCVAASIVDVATRRKKARTQNTVFLQLQTQSLSRLA